MTNIELTQLAAKAIGNVPDGFSPLTDDGDALRLAVKLNLTIYQWPGEICVCNEKGTVNEVVERVGDIYAATRRAIVRAAAEIGRQMQEGGAA